MMAMNIRYQMFSDSEERPFGGGSARNEDDILKMRFNHSDTIV